MTKLYYAPVPGGPAAFISAIAAGLHIETEQVCTETHRTESDVDFFTINSKGTVPCLVLADGTVLNENVAVLEYIADQNPGSIAPEGGTQDRYKLENVLGFLTSELHPIFKEICHGPNGDIRADHQQTLAKKFEYLEKFVIKGKHFLVGNKFSIADAYLFMMLHWDLKAGIDLSPFPELLAFRERVGGLNEVVSAQQKMVTNPSRV